MSDSEQVQQRRKFTKETPRDSSSERTEAQLKAMKALQKRNKKSSLVDYSYHIVVGGFILLCVVALGSTLFQDRRKLNAIPVINEDKIDVHNQEEHLYKLSKNEFFADWMLADAKLIANNQMTVRASMPRCSNADESTIIPEAYNYRTAFPECARPVFNQGNCSSSYAVASVSAFNDRLCVMNKANVNLSVQSVVSCDKKTQGCKGGSVSAAFDYGKKEGYPASSELEYTGSSTTECPKTFGTANKFYVDQYCVQGTEEGIKREILKNGPVVAVMPVYRDFLVYKEGVYEVEEGALKIQGGQAVKVIGWAKDEESNYWIIENSWGETWGLNGFAYVAIGQKSLYIDDYTIAPMPKMAVVETPKEEVVQTNQKQDDTVAEEMDLDK